MTTTSNNIESAPRPTNRVDKEQRRRERRERRARRQLDGGSRRRANMPDILHSHVPPPYSTLPPNRANRAVQSSRWRNNNNPQPSSFPAAVTADLTRSHASFFEDNHHHHIHHLDGSSHISKSCCGVVLNQTVSIRWFIVMIAFVGICCSFVGTILGALKASGREHLTVSLLMIGVGIVLITVSGIAWRLTSPEGPSCRSMMGLSSEADDEYNGRFLSRPAGGALPYGGSRPQHPYAAMMYSDFQYRPPPPSYQASMQEYRLRLLLMDRNSSSNTPGGVVTSAPNGGGPISPPPNYYRSTNSRMVFDSSQFSRPPSYRSHSSEQNLSAIQENSSSSIIHIDSQCTSESRLPPPSTLISTQPIVHRRQNSSSSSSIREENPPKPSLILHPGGNSGGPCSKASSNLVTIVQTSESFALSNNNNNSLIVTVSGSLEAAIRPPPLLSQQPVVSRSIAPSSSDRGEVEILAHL